ncbi:MAG: hypothetical protein QGM46_10635 [Actinomycetota bacterium]|nr:hypothetical protein [Actinomycetota bacterium]MDK1039394.1 hypothetical protein [Actinomycetota bacterium]MDK1097634.1 hypothetical protein [Actinomycetota bacterium]MDK1103368.1 hypothetical protein [Actinomycetota bacterium]MDK1292775.1 hypothetical protein [Actinomycetota bacterium]
MADEVAISMELIEFANSRDVRLVSKFAKTASSIDIDQLHAMYKALRDTAPHRHARDKKYFVGHSGVPSTVGTSTRSEEHLAIALCNDNAAISLGDSGGLRLLDYQVPLKARRADARIGKVDIVALATSGRVAVIELKMATPKSKGDTPLRALLEALAYCAIVEANAQEFAFEIRERYGLHATDGRPDLVVMGPRPYWPNWNDTALAAVYDLSDRLARTFDMQVRYLDLDDVTAAIGIDGKRPQLIGRVSTTVLHEAGRVS